MQIGVDTESFGIQKTSLSSLVLMAISHEYTEYLSLILVMLISSSDLQYEATTMFLSRKELESTVAPER